MIGYPTTCQLYRKSEQYDLYGKSSLQDSQTMPCAVVTYDMSVQQTPISADNSASRRRAEQVTGDALFLFPPKSRIKTSDVVEKDGFRLEVIALNPRHGLFGDIDHVEVRLRPEVEDGS